MKCYPSSNCKVINNLNNTETSKIYCNVAGDCTSWCCSGGVCSNQGICFAQLELPIILSALFAICIACCCFCCVLLLGALMIKGAKSRKDKNNALNETMIDQKITPKRQVIKYWLIQHKTKKIPIPPIEGVIKIEPPKPQPPPASEIIDMPIMDYPSAPVTA